MVSQYKAPKVHPFWYLWQFWYSVVMEEDHPIVDREWEKFSGGETTSFEIRLKEPFVAEEIVDEEKVEGFTWVVAGAYAEKAHDGTVVGILGCLTDVSRQKLAEGFQKRRMLEAVELKRQQENFIDMTSQYVSRPYRV
jgi:hypothetical protein